MKLRAVRAMLEDSQTEPAMVEGLRLTSNWLTEFSDRLF